MSKALAYAIGGAMLLLILIGAYLSIRNSGASDERIKQEKENAQFTVQANKGLVDYDTCDRADGVYDFGKGTCKLQRIKPSAIPAPRG
jgi:hypothetical protein